MTGSTERRGQKANRRMLSKAQSLRCDDLITRLMLHGGRLEPVSIEPILEECKVYYQQMPENVQSFSWRWSRYEKEWPCIALDAGLREPTASMWKRYAVTHEFAHLFRRDPGSLHTIYQHQMLMVAKQRDFNGFLHTCAERDCDYVSAYLLISGSNLRLLKDEDRWYISRTLDVPEHLVDLRRRIFERLAK